jgi:hypothetical protein
MRLFLIRLAMLIVFHQQIWAKCMCRFNYPVVLCVCYEAKNVFVFSDLFGRTRYLTKLADPSGLLWIHTYPDKQRHSQHVLSRATNVPYIKTTIATPNVTQPHKLSREIFNSLYFIT